MVSKLFINNFSACGVGTLNRKAFNGPTFGNTRIKKDNSLAENPGRLYPFPNCLSYSFRRILNVNPLLAAVWFSVSIVFFFSDHPAFVTVGNMLDITHRNVSTAKGK